MNMPAEQTTVIPIFCGNEHFDGAGVGRFPLSCMISAKSSALRRPKNRLVQLSSSNNIPYGFNTAFTAAICSGSSLRMSPFRSKTTSRAFRKRASTTSSSKYRSRATWSLSPPLLPFARARIDVAPAEREFKIKEILRSPKFRRILQCQPGTFPAGGRVDKSERVNSRRHLHRHMKIRDFRLPAIPGSYFISLFAYCNDQAGKSCVAKILVKEVVQVLPALFADILHNVFPGDGPVFEGLVHPPQEG